MQHLSNLIDLGHVAVGIEAEDRSELIGKLTAILVREDHLSASCGQSLKDALIRREKQGGTCLGNGIAVPHGYVVDLDHPIVFLARLKTPIQFSANPEHPPVDLVFLLTGPKSAQPVHVKLLARMVRLFHDRRWLAELRSADSPEAILNSVRSVEQRHV